MKKLVVKIFLLAIPILILGGIYFYINRIQGQKNLDASTSSLDEALLRQDMGADKQEQTEDKLTLIVPEIGLTAPIILNVDGNDKAAYIRALENGIAHLKNTALPGASGNTVIFGHSSYYADQPGNYKHVFSTLDNLNAGNTIEIKSASRIFSYKVSRKLIVMPDEVSVVSQDKSKKELTLITCWPIGSTEKRLVIKADLQS